MPDDSFGTTDRHKNAATNSPGRRAVLYTSVIVGLALLITVVFAPLAANSPNACAEDEVFSCMSVNRYILTFVPSSLLVIGGITAFVKTYTVWRSGGPWKVWHASGWALFVMMIIFVSAAGGSLMA